MGGRDSKDMGAITIETRRKSNGDTYILTIISDGKGGAIKASRISTTQKFPLPMEDLLVTLTKLHHGGWVGFKGLEGME